MTATIFKFPYDASRRVYSRRPRASKNGTPEERAAKAPKVVPATIIDLPEPEERTVDRRKLRGNPMRETWESVSLAVTILGKMHTADLRGESLPADAGGWIEELRASAAATRIVTDELDKAAVRLGQVQRKTETGEANA
jgi:hypothetical protein